MMTTTESINKEQTPRKSYTTLWVMIILFALPYIAAVYFYKNSDGLDLVQNNYGTIVTPVKAIESIDMETLDNATFSFSDLKGKWIFVTIGSSLCEEQCQKNMYKIRQIRKAVAQERSRVERVFLLTDSQDINGFTLKINDYQGMYVIKPSEDKAYDSFVKGFAMPGQKIHNGIYIIDPLGNFMMAYPEDADAAKILDDVRRLLKISQIG
jgi:cytochrome oxidase Cu insertion factor (SCO1/SenC/PrrC family)